MNKLEKKETWLADNWREIFFFLFTWSIGCYLFSIVIFKIDPNCPSDIKTEHWTILFTSIFLLLLPFVSKISLGSILKVEREIKETKKEIKEHKEFTQNQIQFLTNNLNFLSQNLSNNINIYNTAPDAETLKKANNTLDKDDPNNEQQKVEEELDLESSEDEWFWIFNLLKIRIELEKELRTLLKKSTNISVTRTTDIKYLSLNKLFEIYVSKNPDSQILKEPFRLFSNVANSAIHGQNIDKTQYEEAKEIGIKILRNIRITSILGD
jgi:hypothetical protein